MYKSKEQQKLATKEAVKRHREKQKGITQGITKNSKDVIPNDKKCNTQCNTQCPESVVLSDGQIWHPDPKYWRPEPAKEVSEYPAIVQAITDPVQRKRLEAITSELKVRGLGGDVRYGVNGIDFNAVGELLDCVKL